MAPADVHQALRVACRVVPEPYCDVGTIGLWSSMQPVQRIMKVVHIITRLIIGGAQENTLLTVQDQDHIHGDQVTLITGPGLGPEGSLIPQAQQSGIDIRVIPCLRRNIHPLRDLTSYRVLKRTLADIRPQIVHTHSSKAGIVGRAIAADLGLPAVHTIHGASFHYGQNRILHRLYIAAEKWAAQRCERFICVADAMTNEYVQAGIAPREKFVTIYSGMDVDPFLNAPRPRDTVRGELGFEPQHVVIGKVARLFHLKGHEFAIQAARAVVDRQPNVRFLFVGDGILREKYQAELRRLGLSDRFVFTGLVPPAQIPELIHAMDIVVHTSLWEGLARVLPQGLIARKPVISYDIGGAREVVIPGETGFLVPRQPISGLEDAMIRLAADAGLRERYGQAGRDRFTEQFRHEFMTQRIREVYSDVLNRPRR